jgi:hypothetical protein
MGTSAEAKQLQSNRASQLVHESFLALNIGFAITYALFAYVTNWHIAVYAPRPVRDVLETFARFLLRVGPLVVSVPPGVHRRSLIVWEMGFIAFVVLIALFVFALRRGIDKIKTGQFTLYTVSGVLSVVAFPACLFYVLKATRPYPPLQQAFWTTYGVPLALELSLAAGLLYLVRNRPIAWGTLVFTSHYVFSFLVMGMLQGKTLPPTISSLALSLVFPSSGVAWLMYRKGTIGPVRPTLE